MAPEDLDSLNHSIQKQGHLWQAGDTSLSNLPSEEQDLRLGLRIIPEEMSRLRNMFSDMGPSLAEYPPAWDWRNVGGQDWTTEIRDQQACGSCVAFGVVAVVESMLKLRLKEPSLQPDLSEAHLFFCGCGACCSKGWWPSYALNYVMTSGIPDEACFPYRDRNMACTDSCADWSTRAVRATTWSEILEMGKRKEWLATRGPLVGCMAVYRDFYSYVDGVYRHTSGDLAGYHAIGVVGYSDEEGAWICKNSWGPDWGSEGWFKMGYGECGIDSEFPMYGVEDVIPGGPQPPPPPPPPEPGPGCNLVGRWLGHRARGEE